MNSEAIMNHIRTAPDIMERIRRVAAPYLNRPTLEIAEESFGELLDEAGARMVGDEPAIVAALEYLIGRDKTCLIEQTAEVLGDCADVASKALTVYREAGEG